MAARPFWLIILWKEKYAIWVCSLPENCRIVNQICLISGFRFLKNPSNQQTRYVRGKKGLTDKYDNVGPCVVCWVSEKPWFCVIHGSTVICLTCLMMMPRSQSHELHDAIHGIARYYRVEKLPKNLFQRGGNFTRRPRGCIEKKLYFCVWMDLSKGSMYEKWVFEKG